MFCGIRQSLQWPHALVSMCLLSHIHRLPYGSGRRASRFKGRTQPSHLLLPLDLLHNHSSLCACLCKPLVGFEAILRGPLWSSGRPGTVGTLTSVKLRGNSQPL
jgi:hypothetical protein